MKKPSKPRTIDRRKKIVHIAQNARKWADRARHVREYNEFPNDLECFCAIAATHLFLLLKKAKLKPCICANDEHVFVKCSGYIIDVTASQFGEKDVCVRKDNGQYQSGERQNHWFCVTSHTSVKAFMKSQSLRKSTWPHEQKASGFKKWLGLPWNKIPLIEDPYDD
jgi:hypothetical protein